jgi:hypothetical protein
MAYDAGTLSLKCPFCATAYVIKEKALPKMQRPERVIPFAITKENAKGKLNDWLSEGFWAPNDMKDASVINDLVAMYVPMWVFDGKAHSNWSAQSGMYRHRQVAYRTTENGQEVTRYRDEQYTEWYPSNGTHDESYVNIPVPGSPALVKHVTAKMKDGLKKKLFPIIDSYKYEAAKAYDPRYLLGCAVDSGLFPPKEDPTSAEQILISRLEGFEQSACYRLAPGDTKRELHCNTSVFDVTCRLTYVPIYMASFQYKEQIYHFVVNGQNGQVISDEKPISAKKVFIAIGIVAAIAGIIWLVIHFSQGA